MRRWLCHRWLVWREWKREGEKFLPFDRVALRLYRLGFLLAPSWWLIDAREDWGEGERAREREENAIAFYVGMWCLLLLVAWEWGPRNDALASIIGAVALLRLVEVCTTVLGFVLDQREPKIARSLLTIGVLAFQVALIFSILDHSFARDGFLKPQALASHEAAIPSASTPFEYLYLTVTYMTTMGNPYTPITEVAQVLQLAAGASGILLLGIVAARAIGLVGETGQTVAELETSMSELRHRDGEGEDAEG